MKRISRKGALITASALLAASVTGILTGVIIRRHNDEAAIYGNLRCGLDLKAYDDTTAGLAHGYQYALLKRFSSDYVTDRCEIRITRNRESFIDSLKAGVLDMVVIHPGRLDGCDSIAASREIGGLVWVVPADERSRLKTINGWLDKAEEDSLFRETFLDVPDNPHNMSRQGVSREALCPYDSLFKAYSTHLGWDWRLLAALSWQESHFRIESFSRRGAAGLMQLMPATAEEYGARDILDPEENIRAGVRYLSDLQKIFRRKVKKKEEVPLFTIAAYNAGQTKILNCIDYAESRHSFDSTWAGFIALMATMKSDLVAVADSNRPGMAFSGETSFHVNEVLSLYEEFKRSVPFSQDQPSR